MSFIKYIADENHYKEVLSLVGKAKQTVHFCPLAYAASPFGGEAQMFRPNKISNNEDNRRPTNQ